MTDTTAIFSVEMDLKEELELLLYTPNKILKSKQFLNGLYDIDQNYENSFVLTRDDYQFMNTLEGNLKCLSP